MPQPRWNLKEMCFWTIRVSDTFGFESSLTPTYKVVLLRFFCCHFWSLDVVLVAISSVFCLWLLRLADSPRFTTVSHLIVRVITAVCSLLHVFTPNYDSIRWLSPPLWQYEELVFDISTQSLNLGVFSTFSFMELVFFLYWSPLVFSGDVAGSIVFEAYRHFVVWFFVKA